MTSVLPATYAVVDDDDAGNGGQAGPLQRGRSAKADDVAGTTSPVKTSQA